MPTHKKPSLAKAVAKGAASTMANTKATRAVNPAPKAVKATKLPAPKASR